MPHYRCSKGYSKFNGPEVVQEGLEKERSQQYEQLASLSLPLSTSLYLSQSMHSFLFIHMLSPCTQFLSLKTNHFLLSLPCAISHSCFMFYQIKHVLFIINKHNLPEGVFICQSPIIHHIFPKLPCVTNTFILFHYRTQKSAPLLPCPACPAEYVTG